MKNLMVRIFNKEASRPEYKAGEIVEQMQLCEGDVVADIGSGGGYFTFEFSKKIGNSGTVYAVDTKLSYLNYIEIQALKRDLDNIRTVLAEGDSLGLPERGVDKMFLRNVFHHLPDPVGYFSGLRRFLRPDGKITIIDHREKSGFSFVSLFRHFTPEVEIIECLTESGYQLSERYDFLPGQSFLVFSQSE